MGHPHPCELWHLRSIAGVLPHPGRQYRDPGRQYRGTNVIAANESLTARFYGNIGPDGCWSLMEVDRQATSATLDVTFHGEHDVRSGHECTGAPVALNHVEVVAPPLATPFTITVHQPDGLLSRRVVKAR